MGALAGLFTNGKPVVVSVVKMARRAFPRVAVPAINPVRSKSATVSFMLRPLTRATFFTSSIKSAGKSKVVFMAGSLRLCRRGVNFSR